MSEHRLIDANALLKEFEKRQEQQCNEYCDCFLNDAQELSTEWWCVEDAVTAAPTIDAVPVVRCRECIYKDIPKCCPYQINGFEVVSNWYCPMGVRKMDAKEADHG